MNIETGIYYLGYLAALFLCWGLGRMFFIPMLLNLGFDLFIQFDLMAGWDIRWIMISYGFLFFIWTSALAGIFDRVTVVVLLAVDLLTAYVGIMPRLQAVGIGQEFWDKTSTGIFQIWLLSIMIVSLSAIFKSSVLSKIKIGYSELLIIPKRRFLIPIALWSAIWVIPDYLHGTLAEYLGKYRSEIAAQVLVWGWVAFELPFYLMYKRGHDAAS